MHRTDVTIRPATPADIDAIYDVVCSVHLSPFYEQLIPADRYSKFLQQFTPTPERLEKYRMKVRARLEDPAWFYWVAVSEDGTVCGVTLAHREADSLRLEGLFVSEAYQGQGIGKQLFRVSCEAAEGRPITFDVLANNQRAISMYEREGFERSKSEKGSFYGAPLISMHRH